MAAVLTGAVNGVGLAVKVGGVVSVGMNAILVGEITVSVGEMVEVGLVVAGLQAASRKVKENRMVTNFFIRILPLVSSCNLLETFPQYYIQKILVQLGSQTARHNPMALQSR
jgi:hypothetical protein